jgi:hypothetical protein
MRSRNFAAWLLTGLLAVVPSGCALTYSVPPERLPAAIGGAMVERWPLEVGVFYMPAGREAVAADAAWRVPLGDAVAATIDWSLAQMFASVRTVDRLPSPSLPSQLAGVIVVRSAEAQPYPAVVTLDVALVAPDGATVAEWGVTGRGEWGPGPGISAREFFATVAADFALALRDASAVFMTGFISQPGVRAWLAANGVAHPAAVPVFAAGQSTDDASPRVVLLSDAATWRYGRTGQAMSCLGDRLVAARPPVSIMDAEDLRSALFPWLERSTAPSGAERLLALIAQSAVQRKLAALGVRYLVDFSGGTTMDIGRGGIFCGAGYGGGGCLGFAWGSRESSFRATVLDVRQAMEVAAEAVQERGGVYVPALILPIPLIAATETAACDALAVRVHGLVTGTRTSGVPGQ